MTRAMLGKSTSLMILAVAVLGGCGSDSNFVVGVSPTPTRTGTPAPTVTRTPTVQAASALEGLVVVRDDVAPRAAEAGVPPTGWGKPADEAAFDRSLANADYNVNGTQQSGTTAPDGGFVIPDLPPGRYTIDLTKTVDGNLLPITVPVVVGDDGASNVVVEVGTGLIRTTARYSRDGAEVEEVRGPYGTWLVLRDGNIAELGDVSRTLIDADGDGQFDAGNCPPPPTLCREDDRTCPDGSFCQCLSSCPFCDNCEHPGICGAGLRNVYRCQANDTCVLPGDHCVDACPDCVDGSVKVCVPSCEPADITGITIGGVSQLVVGRQSQLYATAQLSDGGVIDVTYLVDWQSSDDSVAAVDSWGRVSARQIGNVSITARLGEIGSVAFAFEVVSRPTLRSIIVQNTGCYCRPYFDAAGPGVAAPCFIGAPEKPASLPFPSCSQTIVIGNRIQFTALGEYADNTYEDLTKVVEWSVEPSGVGEIDAGQFTGLAVGTATIHASLDGVTSNSNQVRVVSEPSIESLSIYPGNYAYDALRGGSLPDSGLGIPCFDCAAEVTVLRGDTLRFQATAHYDTGEWRDVTDQVTWQSNDAGIATIDASGVMTAVAGGFVTIDATLAGKTSNPVHTRVVNEATLTYISIYQEGYDRVVAKADQRFFRATGVYDIGLSRDVTSEAAWRSSDDAIGGFDTAGVFTARSAGVVSLWAELGGQQSMPIALEVYEATQLSYCDANDINRGMWSDDFNRVILESDCHSYTQPGLVTLRYTVTETRPHGGIFDPCLDLYVYDGEQKVRTIREEGCGEPFLPNGAPGRDEAALKYQLRAFWDLKDETGAPVAPGTYTIYGRFYLYYDPIVSIDVEVGGGSGTPRPTRPPASPTPTPAPDRIAALTIGSVIGQPGEKVSFAMTLKSIGIPIAGLQNDLVFNGLGVDTSNSGRPLCSVDPALNKSGSAFAFLPVGCMGASCSSARALIVATDNVDPIPDGAVVYSCTTSIPPNTAPGVYRIGCANASASDPQGTALGLRCSPGAIQVGTPGDPPPPAADIEGNCYLGSASCGVNSFHATARERCCAIAAHGGIAVALSWCPAQHVDDSGKCTACESPCGG